MVPSLKASGITHKHVEELRVAGIHLRASSREDLTPHVEQVHLLCKEHICGPAIALYDYGVYTDGIDIEVCFPVREPVQTDEVSTRTLKSVEVLSLIHRGPHTTLRESYRTLYTYMAQHGIEGTSYGREIYVNVNKENPAENITEVQAVLHKWEDRLARNVDRVLGPRARERIMEGSTTLFTLESTPEERACWVKSAMQALDTLANDDQKFDVLSRCAHDFSEKRIANLRAVYEKEKKVDDVLKAMYEDPLWYEDPQREGNVIYMEKVPYNRKGYAEAQTAAEKRRNYCHCPLVRDYLDEIPPTFCHCGAGWYRQIWEGILGRPVRVTMLKSLTKGDDTCQFAIYLPEEL